MADKQLPTPETLRQLLRYEPETGKLFWRERGPEWFNNRAAGTPQEKAARWNMRWAGKMAFKSIDSLGYHQSRIGFYGKPVQLRAHRVIWAIQTGSWPSSDVDHVNRIKTDNRWINLRVATRSQNLANRSVAGVSRTRSGSWAAYVTKDYRRTAKTFGMFCDAVKWRRENAKAAHGEFAP